MIRTLTTLFFAFATFAFTTPGSAYLGSWYSYHRPEILEITQSGSSFLIEVSGAGTFFGTLEGDILVVDIPYMGRIPLLLKSEGEILEVAGDSYTNNFDMASAYYERYARNFAKDVIKGNYHAMAYGFSNTNSDCMNDRYHGVDVPAIVLSCSVGLDLKTLMMVVTVRAHYGIEVRVNSLDVFSTDISTLAGYWGDSRFNIDLHTPDENGRIGEMVFDATYTGDYCSATLYLISSTAYAFKVRSESISKDYLDPCFDTGEHFLIIDPEDSNRLILVRGGDTHGFTMNRR